MSINTRRTQALVVYVMQLTAFQNHKLTFENANQLAIGIDKEANRLTRNNSHDIEIERG